MEYQDDSEFSRVIGRRKVLGISPGTITKEMMDWMDSMNNYKTRIPKGIFRYKNHEEANNAMDEWLVQTMVASAKTNCTAERPSRR